jgi:hypothetical protein
MTMCLGYVSSCVGSFPYEDDHPTNISLSVFTSVTGRGTCRHGMLLSAQFQSTRVVHNIWLPCSSTLSTLGLLACIGLS